TGAPAAGLPGPHAGGVAADDQQGLAHARARERAGPALCRGRDPRHGRADGALWRHRPGPDDGGHQLVLGRAPARRAGRRLSAARSVGGVQAWTRGLTWAAAFRALARAVSVSGPVASAAPMRRLTKLSGLPNRRRSVPGSDRACATPSNTTF